MKNYHNTVKFIFGLVVIFQISSIFFGFLRPSIIYDYLDYWPLTILPLILLFLFRKTNIREQVSFYSYMLLILVFIFFQVGHYIKGDFLTTYGYDSSFENLNLDSKIEHELLIDVDNSIELNYFLGNGYKVDILNKPGNSGYPETIETLIGEPRAIIFREIDTSYLLKVKGWKVDLGSENIDAVIKGCKNLEKHVENIGKFGVPVVVAINDYVTDTKKEHAAIIKFCKNIGVDCKISSHWDKGGLGAVDLAEEVAKERNGEWFNMPIILAKEILDRVKEEEDETST